jgi:hypothetical protein
MEGLISPPASAASPAPSNASAVPGLIALPLRRQHPLRAGSEKEIALINYLDGKMLRISRRYGKKFTDANENDDSPGYTGIDQVIADIDPLIDVAWISGTRKSNTDSRESNSVVVRAIMCCLYNLCLSGYFCYSFVLLHNCLVDPLRIDIRIEP